MRERFCKICGGWHNLKAWPHNCLPERNMKRSDLPGPMIITDTMDPVQSMASGAYYESKSALRAEYKRLGVTEVGTDSSITDPKPFKKPKPDRQQIKASVNKAFSRAGLGA